MTTVTRRTTSVFLFEEKPLFRDSFDRALREEPGIALAGVAGELDYARILGTIGRVDVVVVGVDGFSETTHSGLANMRRRWPEVGLVVLLGNQDRLGIRRLSAFCAQMRHGYALLLRDNINGPGDLLHAVNAASEGRVVVDSAVMDALLRADRGPAGIQDRLSDRELQVLDLMAEGFRNKAIASNLLITDKTVERHIQNIYAKIGEPPESIQPRAHAVAIYQEEKRAPAGLRG
jgi:DNA-binding NarL/FixJ family response regulator